MSAALPLAEPCCIEACEDVVIQNIPGPAGSQGAAGLDGADGISAVTTLSAAYTMPAEMASAQATVATTSGLTIGETVFVQSLGTLEVTAIASANLVTLKNIEDTTAGAYPANAAPGTIAPVGSRISPTGLQGPAGIITGTVAGGQLKGTYPNPTLLIPNTLGALAVGNGTDAVSLVAGTAGYVPVNDATTFPATGLGHKKIIPITGDANVATDRLVRLSAATGLPIPLIASKASLKDPGGLGVFVADATAGDARGVDAVDLQVNRPTVGVGAVASGAQAVILGGEDNTASAQRAVVVGGQRNACTGAESFIGGGESHIVDSAQSSIVGGDNNTISGALAEESFIGGGADNIITGLGQATIGGGDTNGVSAQWGSILGGLGNGVSAAYGVVAGGATNAVSGQYGSVLGGGSNTASGFSAAIVGGSQALADKYAQRAFAAGRFAAQGDCQQSELIWRISTANNTITEAFLDGNSLRATIAVGRSVAFDFLIVGRSSAGVTAAWKVVGAIQNNGGTTALVAAVTTTVIADGTGGTWGVAGGVTIDADNANDALRVQVTGAAATLIRWAITARLMELSY